MTGSAGRTDRFTVSIQFLSFVSSGLQAGNARGFTRSGGWLMTESTGRADPSVHFLSFELRRGCGEGKRAAALRPEAGRADYFGQLHFLEFMKAMFNHFGQIPQGISYSNFGPTRE